MTVNPIEVYQPTQMKFDKKQTNVKMNAKIKFCFMSLLQL